ncbi:hypothetical protein HZA73_06725 [candidate division TA06 bacterium]|nr:hypothetical protein [candidate division TA06 bacterium]
MNIYAKTSDIVRWKYSYQILYFIAALNGLVGVLSIFITSEILITLGGKFVIFSSILFALLALFIHKKKSNVAAWIATICWSIEILSTIVSVIWLNKEIFFVGIFMKIFILYYIAGGIGAVKRIRNAEPLVATASPK